MKDATAKLARHVADLKYEQLPRELVDLLKQCILDTLGVAIAASTLAPEAKIVLDYVNDLGGKPVLETQRPQRGQMARPGRLDDGDHAEPLRARNGGCHRAAAHAAERVSRWWRRVALSPIRPPSPTPA